MIHTSNIGFTRSRSSFEKCSYMGKINRITAALWQRKF